MTGATAPLRSERATPRAAGGGASIGVLSWLGAAGIAAVAVLRAVVVISPDTAFATDPYLDPAPSSALGPIGSMTLDVLLIAFAALGLIGEGLSRRRLDIGVLSLALLPIPVVIWHGVHDFDDLWRGWSWVAAAIAAAVAAQLARQRELRLLMAATLAAVVVPLCIRGLMQVFIEHGEMVETYERDRAAILAARGIDPASSGARVFETRLYQPEATAWFGLANVFGSFVVAGLIVWTGWTIATIRARARLESGFAGVMAIVAILCAVGVVLAGSKGAYAAAFLGLATLALLATFARRTPGGAGAGQPSPWGRRVAEETSGAGGEGRPISLHSPLEARLERVAGGLALSAIALPILAVVVRGATLPESFAGERSILFRWHYWIGAGRMIAENPVAGVGPAGFQDAFVRHRLPITPEEAASAHNVFIDWIATLGISGMAWIALVLVLLWRAGACRRDDAAALPDAENEGNRAAEKRMTSWVTVVAFAAFVPALLIEQPALDARAVFFRALGVMGFLGAAAIGAKALRRAGGPLIACSVAAGAMALLAHAQIEVTLTQPSAAAWGLVLLGLAAGRPARVSGPANRWGLGIGSAMLASVVAFAVIFLIPALWQAREMDRAAERLRRSGLVRLALLDVAQAPNLEALERSLERLLQRAQRSDMTREAIDTIRQASADPSTSLRPMLESLAAEVRWRERIDRSGASEMLLSAHAMLPSNSRPFRYSLEQSLARLEPSVPADLQSTSARVDELVTLHPEPASIALAARIEEHCADLSGLAFHVDRAIGFRRRLVDLDPHGLAPRLGLADLLAKFGRAVEARAEYRRALEMNDRWHLDPMRQLSREERERIERLTIDD